MANEKEEAPQMQNEQLQKMLEEKSAALELMQREAAIEAALEKVRSRSLTIHKSDELKEVVTVLFEKLRELQIPVTSAGITIFMDGSKDLNIYVCGQNDEGLIISNYLLPYFNHPICNDLHTAREKHLDFFVGNYSKDEKNSFYEQLLEHTSLKGLPNDIKEMIFQSPKYAISMAPVYHSMITINDFEGKPLSETETNIIKRFARVFEQAYIRFLDLQKAEAQAREAKIEAALERVRSKTMAMQRSAELADVATILFQQVKALGVPQWTCGFSIFEIDDKEFTWYPGSADGDILSPVKIPLTEHPVFISFNESRKRGDELFIYEKAGEVQADHYRYMMSLPGIRELLQKMLDAGLSFPSFQIDHLANFSHGNMIFITYEPVPEMWDVFKRFAKVFEQTYTRFLDLQNAEAQARESQIQLALERVRARTMAMQKSEELTDAASLLFKQIADLGIELWSTAFQIWNADDISTTAWPSAPDGSIQAPFRLPYNEDIFFKRIYDARQSGKDFFVMESSGKELEETYHYMFNLPGVKKYFDDAQDLGFQVPKYQITHCAFFSNGYLMFITYELVPEAHDIFKRFAKVFEQTYTRFLDLQKSEAQARESQIQLALERVRARTMAMQKSDELPDAALLLSTQVKELGIQLWSTSFQLWDNDRKAVMAWTALRDIMLEPIKIPATEDSLMINISAAAKKGELLYVEEMGGKVLDSHLKYMNSLPGVKEEFGKIVDAGFSFPAFNIFHAAYFSTGFILFITEKSYPEAHDIFKRFAKVFEQTYTRFLDLQKAEEQAREARIENALEKVRSRTMAMQRSEELPEAANNLFLQVQALGIPAWSAGYCIWDEDKKGITLWMSSEGVMQPSAHAPCTEDPSFIHMREAYERGDAFHVEEIGGEALVTHYKYMRTLPVVGEILDSIIAAGHPLPTFQIFHCVYFSQGFLLFITYEKVPEAHIIFKRFTNVFEQTYTRFLDLQKAEAQAREAQIQLALERVRARTMAMQKSDELTEVAGLLFKQVTDLGINSWTAGFNVWSDDNNSYVDYITSPNGGFIKPYKVLTDRAEALQDISTARKSGVEFDVQYVEGEKIKQLYIALTGLGEEQFEKMRQDGNQFPSHQYEHFVFGSRVSLMFITYEPVPEAHDIFKSFGKVFEQTYTRFLDLQKAEAQAREAKIETALERVRSRTMAMQKSEELQDTAFILFQQIQALDVSIFGCGFNIWDDDRKAATAWMARQDGIAPPFKTSSSEDIFFHIHEAAQRGESLFVREQGGEELETHYRYMATIPIFKEVVEQMAQAGFYLPTFQIMHCAYFTQGYLMFITYEPVPEAYDIFKRFAKVFEQTYTRFLDLQKAEAQAREAQIEGTLESIRSASLAMHHSNQLKTVAAVMFKKLIELGLTLSGAFIFLFDRKSRDIQLWIATTTLSEPGEINIPFNQAISNNSIFKDLWNVIENGEEIFNRVYSGKEKNEYFRHVGEHNTFPQEVKDFHQTSIPWITSIAGEKHAALGFDSWDNKLATTEDFQILKRFSKVFEQAYVRFLDLQKAEAQGLEAVKRASVDRVRAEIASMRTTNDLERITPIMWRELTTIGVPFIRCGVFIMDEEQQQVHTFLSTPDGEAIAAFHMPYNAPGETAQIIASWQKKQMYAQHWNEAQFIEFTKNLEEQGAITSGEKYLAENRPTDLYLHFLPFLQGMLYAGNTTALSDDELQLVQNLADAFSTAYARYEDFNKLESAKEQIEKTLVDLKQAQAQLVQSAKMASLGELTAGIAHEIQNPLNFVNNFSEVNKEMLEELKAERLKPIAERDEQTQSEIIEDVIANSEKINHHGKRADAIVKGMLQHSRSSTSAKEPTNINALADEYLRLAYHGLRAKDKSFNATLKTDFDESIGSINIIPQDIGRVLLNLINNAFYAVNEKQKTADHGLPTVSVTTKKAGDKIEIFVRDNGNGIPQKVVDKIFQPFFTTKPTGQGTGLGLSLAYDIVKAHGGELKVETKEGEGTEFIIQLPIKNNS